MYVKTLIMKINATDKITPTLYERPFTYIARYTCIKHT